MTFVSSFLHSAIERGLIEHDGEKAELLLTPQWPTSRHVVTLVVRGDESAPSLVAKIPRLDTDEDGLAHEAANLEALHAATPSPFDGAPRLVAFERFNGTAILVQTALAGRTITPPMLRKRSSERVIAAVLEWLGALPSTEPTSIPWDDVVDEPLDRYVTVVGEAGQQLVAKTKGLLEPLRSASIPLVFEHGDLSHPNLLLLRNGRLGVLDWELARPRGLPVHDLAFFLGSVALARARASSRAEQVGAFDAAFVRPDAWARRLFERYAAALAIPRLLLAPLVLACWARYTSRLLARVSGDIAGRQDVEEALSFYPYHAFWHRTVEMFDRLA
jgi:aminoglycoside phosphotransferase (APT) family kinase protein